MQAAFTGKIEFGKAVRTPFFFGWGLGSGGQQRSGLPSQTVSIDKLRRFSQSPVPRRFINYLRFSLTRLGYDVTPVTGGAFRKKDEKNVERLLKLLRDPNPDDTWDSWLGQMIEDMLTPGWAMSEIRRFDAGGEDQPYQLWPVDGASIQVDRNWDGSPSKPRYFQMDYRGDEIPFKNNELMVWKYVPRSSTPFGLSPVDSAMNEIEFLLNAQAFAGRTASNAQPKKLLWLQGFQEDQINTMRSWWRDTIEGSGTLPIAGGDDGTDAKTIELGLVTDANLFISWQEMLIVLIADAFGVDPMKAGISLSTNRSNADSLNNATDDGAIVPLAKSIEQYINKWLIPLFDLEDVAEFRFQFNTSISDQKATATINQVELQDESCTINEARARMGRGPLLHPTTGEDIGNITVSAYRALVNKPEFMTGGFAGLKEALDRQVELQQQATDAQQNGSGDGNGRDGKNRNNDNPDPSQRGGNGVNSAAKPKQKAYNKRSDPALETS